MATIRKRGNTYQIRVSCGYDTSGNQVEQSMTWKPTEKMTAKQIEKELNRQAVMFEEACMQGQIVASVKFEDFAKQWFHEYAEIKLKTYTLRNYHCLEKRVYKAIGHLRMDRITPRQIQQFINGMANENRKDIFGEKGQKLAPKTIKLHVSFISTIFDYAVKMQMLQNNPCRNVTLPSAKAKEREIYTLEEAQEMLDLLGKESDENLNYVVFFTLAVFTGLRRGELLGLEWKDFDFEKSLMTVNRTSMWTKERGTFTDTPKTKTSVRTLKLTDDLIAMLNRFRGYQNNCKINLGSKWIETDRLFTWWNGEPMKVKAPYAFFKAFCERNNLRFVSIHSMRHLNASLLINAGVDVKTVQSCLGHSTPTTTLQIYSHSFQAAQAAAMDCVANSIHLRSEKT